MEPKKNTIESLMEQGKTNGKLTTKEITDALEELDFDVDQLNTFMTIAKISILKSLRTFLLTMT